MKRISIAHESEKLGGMSMLKRNLQMLILVAGTVGAILLAIMNSFQMHDGLRENTQDYGDQVTSMISQSVNAEINNGLLGVTNIADSVAQLTVDEVNIKGNLELREFLSRKAQIYNLDTVMLLDSGGEFVLNVVRTPIGINKQKLSELSAVWNAQQGEAGVGVLDQSICYTAPIRHSDHVDVLIGIISRERLLKLIDGKSFGGETQSCIVDILGAHVVAPTDMDSFLYLDELFEKGELHNIELMLRYNYGSSLFFADENGDEKLLSVDPLGINDWRLLTIVPMELITGNSSHYIYNTVLIILLFAFLFLIMLFAVYHANKRNEKQLYALAYEDPITKGLNGAAFRMYYRNTVQKSRTALPHAIAMLNVRNFRLVNERLGFEVGDNVLRIIHSCILDKLYEDRYEFVGRSETDHFFICLDERSPAAIQIRIKDIEQAINKIIEQKDICYPLSVLGGCCVSTGLDEDIHVLKERARIAERDNKPEYERCLFYDGEIVSRQEKEAELEFAFKKAMENREFQVYYQPKVRLGDNAPVGAEALVRWNHPTLGKIAPNEFIPLFERTGKICQIDFYVFEEVCRFYQKRKSQGLEWHTVSVNLSRYHFYEENFLDKFIATAQSYKLEKGSIEFELTETMFFDEQQTQNIKISIENMHKAGFLCSIDDFGVGYSSLGMLKDFEVDTLKMDRMFFKDLANTKARDIIQSVIQLTKKLGMSTVAEGVEEKEQVDFLKGIGCDMIQGYYFSRPVPEKDFEEWLKNYKVVNN